MSRLRRNLYGGARELGDIEAAAKGPEAYAKRRIRRKVYARSNGVVGKLLRGFGL